MELYCPYRSGDLDFFKLTGSFAVKDGVTYRETAYWKESALFALCDIEKKTELARVLKEELQERFQSFAKCDYRGVRYQMRKIEGGNAYFSPFANINKIYCYPVQDINEILIQRNYGGGRTEIEVLYRKPGIAKSSVCDRFYPEEMHNGNLMVSYLEEDLNWFKTKKLLEKLYQDISFGEPDPAGLIVDECISWIKIDGEEFDFTQDLAYGLITISPRSAQGNEYIREMCVYFNQMGKFISVGE